MKINPGYMVKIHDAKEIAENIPEKRHLYQKTNRKFEELVETNRKIKQYTYPAIRNKLENR